MRLRNLDRRELTLDPEKLQGAWLAVTFHQPRLAGHGQAGHESFVYLISAQPFDASFTTSRESS